MTKTDIARQCYRAYETRDRKLLEDLLAEDFVFSSPRDDFIDRATYFTRCWPNSDNIRNFTFELRFIGDRISSADVYSGRTLEQDQH